MTIKITIIGTGQIGASIGLALAERKDQFLRVGHDKNLQTANRAKALGAVDRVDFNLPGSVEDASIIILAIPQDQIRETLQHIASELKEDSILMDTAPLKGDVIQWTKELLPPRRYYVGLTPVINPIYLEASDSGVEASHADLFKDGLMAIYLPPDLPGGAIKLATDFSALLGAEHMFIDPLELDSMMAATHLLPQLLAAAYLNSTVDQPGWPDVRKLTGRPYAMLTAAMGDSSEIGSLSEQAILAHESLVLRIDLLMENLERLRQQLSSADIEKMKLDLEHARQGHESWLKDRKAANWAVREMGSHVELPTSKQVFTRMFKFGGERKPKPPK
jgi:prephenate dehydrogenase